VSRQRRTVRRHVTEPVIVLGTEIGTGKVYALRHAAFQRGVHILGAIGAGKTSLLLRLLYGIGTRYPWVLHDFIGTGHRRLQAWVAYLATTFALAERWCPDMTGSTARFLSRYAFLTIGDANPAIRIDLLRRRRLPDGTLESVRDVTGRALEIFFAKLNDPDAALRVRFRRIATAVLACMVAAERSITEAYLVLDDPMYVSFLERELAKRRFRRSDHRFLIHQLAELHHVLALRPSDPTKSWRAFEDMTESTRNSFSDCAPGTLMGEILGDETFPLEAVAYGRTSLSVTTRHADETLKSQIFQALHGMLHALFLARPDIAGLPPLTYIVDEPRWVRRNFPGVLAVSRNLGVSYVIAHQARNQFEDLGLRTLPDQLRSLTNLQIAFRPTSFADAEDETLHTHDIRPDGLVLRFMTSSSSDATTDSYAIHSAWNGLIRPFGSDSTWSSGSTYATAEHESVHPVGFQDQVRYLAAAALRRPRFTGSVIADGIGTEVAFAAAPVFPSDIGGVPVLDYFRTWHDRYWWSCLVPRAPYEPHGSIVVDVSPVAPAAQEEAHGVTVAPTAPPAAEQTTASTAAPTLPDATPAPSTQPVAPPSYQAADRRGRRTPRRRQRRRGAAQ